MRQLCTNFAAIIAAFIFGAMLAHCAMARVLYGPTPHPVKYRVRATDRLRAWGTSRYTTSLLFPVHGAKSGVRADRIFWEPKPPTK